MPSASDPKALHIANDLRLAAEDAKDARTLLAVKSRNAAYHAQQATEKLLLALLTSEDLHAQRHESHQLGIMIEKLPPQLQELIVRSMALQAKVRRLDTTIHAPAAERAAIGNPLVPQLNRLKAAFER